jgi:hypothetical protein
MPANDLNKEKPTMKGIFDSNRPLWDTPNVRPDARYSIQRMLDCRTAALGAEIYESDSGERRLVYHTCKSRACTSCGMRRMLDWQREVEAWLPAIAFAGVGFTMPNVFWPIFQQNRHLLHHLPEIAAGALQDWAKTMYGAEVMILAVPHTFGGRFNFNVHVHLLVSVVGLDAAGKGLVRNLYFPRDAMVRAWRHTLLNFLTTALEAGLLHSDKSRAELKELFREHQDRLWVGWIKHDISTRSFFRYISRYVLRPPMAEHRLLASKSPGEIHFLSKDTKMRKKNVPMSLPVPEFVALFIDHIPDRHRHGIRYFGLLAPRCKGRKFDVFLALLNHRQRPKPRRLSWRVSIWMTYRRDPLADSQGDPMRRIGRLAPISSIQSPRPKFSLP